MGNEKNSSSHSSSSAQTPRFRVSGKCILLGEHSVVRGHPALVFPLQSRSLELMPSKETNAFSDPLKRTLDRAMEMLAWKKELPSVKVESTIPMRAGLGSSAALSVAVVRFLQWQGAPITDAFSFALELENLFHGKSSGIDVAAVLEGQPIRFQKSAAPKPLTSYWKPHLYLVDTGLRSSTKACVEKVTQLQRPDLDEAMAAAVQAAEQSFLQKDLKGLAEQINKAHEVFQQWNLVPEEVEKQRQELMKAGALAVKLTGSGDGGFLLSLWDRASSGISLWEESPTDARNF